ncbi:DUF4974 domain-containing protein [Niastella caeni]|uniref:DUF4974 domain-containing protein n=1 Tax=Niastella caeni TaxID=2569763 RepID=A0A4S8HYS9_9BACT|nr:FecR domain-containing protein [Niastella caeni]THU39324.1 DUF4974 domain-containing protein [Niastella caeni]
MHEKADDIILMERVEEVATLLHKFLKDELSPEEKTRLDSWVNQSTLNRAIFQEVSDKDTMTAAVREYYQLLQQIEEIRKRHSAERARVIDMFSKKTVWPRYVAAASIILLITLGGYFYINKEKPQQEAATASTTPSGNNDIPPAGNKATLTLANGSQIVLTDADNGVVAHEGKTTINKNQDGQLEYNAAFAGEPTLAYNTVTTPKGGKYQLILPDGSKVWLNAASSLRFPIAFTGEKRTVELTGEAYFEIAPLTPKGESKKMPFIVKINTTTGDGGEVEVLGTHFNINAYSDEKRVKTTLLEGSVKVTSSGSVKAKMLQPGQQAILNTALNDINVINKENAESAISWIRGKFAFESASFNSMMQELSRWYDVQVKYEGAVPGNTITGEVDRTIPLTELLSILEKMGNTRFKIEGRTVKVMPE